MSAYLKALLYTAVAGVVTVGAMELARLAQQRYSADVEVRVRGVMYEAARARRIDKQVRRETPYLLFDVWETLEAAAAAHEEGADQ